MFRPENHEGSIAKRRFWCREYSLSILLLITALLIAGTIFVFRGKLEDLEGYGYLGAFLIGVLSNATLVLPVPGLLIVLALGAALNPILVGMLAGFGAGLGELTGYMAGYAGREVVVNRRLYTWVEDWMKRRAAITIFAFSLVPFLPFDVVGLLAGAVRFPLWRFLLLCCSGRIPMYIGICFASDWLIDLIKWLGA